MIARLITIVLFKADNEQSETMNFPFDRWIVTLLRELAFFLFGQGRATLIILLALLDQVLVYC